MQSGDVHVAAYDMGNRVAYVSRGMTDSKGSSEICLRSTVYRV